MGVYYSSLMGTEGMERILDRAWGEDHRSHVPRHRDVKSLPKISITEEHLGDGLQCSVCTEDYHIGEEAVQLQCLHLFHTHCIVPWIKQHDTCPLCRKSLHVDTKSSSPSSQSNPTSGPDS